ncbi:MAG: hypothetical protein ABR954_08310 [Dehalococcoidales bacterium]
MKTVYIFGAGASYAYDQSPTGVCPPLARGFFQAYKDLPISEDLEVRVGELINHVRDTYGLSYEKFNSFDQDIEKFMTHLDIQLRQMALMRPKNKKTDTPDSFIRFWQSVRVYDEMLFLIAHVLNEIQNGPVSSLYSAIVNTSGPQDIFITFNWDTLIDRSLMSLGNWSPDDGYGVPFLKIYDNGWKVPKPNAVKPRLLKLHGSTNWLVPYLTWRLDTGERCILSPNDPKGATTLGIDYQYDPVAPGAGIKLHIGNQPWIAKQLPKPPDRLAYPICMVNSSVYYSSYKDRWRTGYNPFSYFFPPDHPETNVPLMPLIVAPVLFKMYDEFAYVLDNLWKTSEQELKLADKITIIGYSFPKTDNRTVDLLRVAASRKEQPLVEVVNPNPENVANLLVSLVGFDETRIKQIPTDFAKYIQEIFKGTTIHVNHEDDGNKPRLDEHHPIPIIKGRFESFPLAAGFERFIISDEKEWYEYPVKNSLGVLCKDRIDNDWAYAILTQSDDGLYSWNDGEVSLHSRADARKKLLDKMEK